MTSIQINFAENSLCTYYSGQNISGSVELRLEKPKKLEGFTLQIKGTAEVAWTERRRDKRQDRRDRHETIRFHAKEKLLRSETALVVTNGEQLELPAGVHVYNFSCFLPANLPSSFEGEHGHIRYCAVATISRSWKFDNTEEAPFRVLKLVDLNLNFDPIHLRQPHIIESEEYFCFKSGILNINGAIPRTGYAIGETIQFELQLDNNSGVILMGIATKINQIATFTSATPHKERKVVKKVILRDETSVSNEKSGRYTVQLEIPFHSFITTASCTPIDVCYELQVKIRVAGCCRMDPRFQVPIVIGTVPLASAVVQPNQITPTIAFVPSAPAENVNDEGIALVNPPSYFEAMQMPSSSVNDKPSAIGWNPMVYGQ